MNTGTKVNVSSQENGSIMWLPPDDLNQRLELLPPSVQLLILRESYIPLFGKLLEFLRMTARVDPSIASFAINHLDDTLDDALLIMELAEQMRAGIATNA